jgi:hypothetical protein
MATLSNVFKGHFIKKGTQQTLHNVHSTFSFTPSIKEYSLLILSLILHLRFAITIWMKTDKFSQAVMTQHNGQQIFEHSNLLPYTQYVTTILKGNR